MRRFTSLDAVLGALESGEVDAACVLANYDGPKFRAAMKTRKLATYALDGSGGLDIQKLRVALPQKQVRVRVTRQRIASAQDLVPLNVRLALAVAGLHVVVLGLGDRLHSHKVLEPPLVRTRTLEFQVLRVLEQHQDGVDVRLTYARFGRVFAFEHRADVSAVIDDPIHVVIKRRYHRAQPALVRVFGCGR